MGAARRRPNLINLFVFLPDVQVKQTFVEVGIEGWTDAFSLTRRRDSDTSSRVLLHQQYRTLSKDPHLVADRRISACQ